MAARYDQKARKELIEAIRQSQKEGLDVFEMVHRFNNAGPSTASGRPWTQMNLLSFINRHKRSLGGRASRSTVSQGGLSPSMLEAIIVHAESPKQAARVIMACFEGSA